MKPSYWIARIGFFLALSATFSACTPSNHVTPGAPVLVKFVVVTPAGGAAELATDAGTPIPVPPLSYAYALFDRILDPTALEDLDADGGRADKVGVASFSWDGGEIPATTLYIPNGSAKNTLIPAAFFNLPYGVGPSLTIKPEGGSLPSGAMVTVSLDPQKVRSEDQKSSFVADMGVSSPLMFETEPLMVSGDAPQAPPPDAAPGDDGGDDGGAGDDAGASAGLPPPVDPSFVLHLTFNNFTDDTGGATGNAIQVVTTIAGVPVPDFVPVVELADAMNPVWTVHPDKNSAWPAGATVEVTVGAEVHDRFYPTDQLPGGKLAESFTTTFTVMP